MRLIDADALEKDLARRWDTTDCADFADKEVWRALREAPTIDAVPVVRCKDCRDREVCITSDDWYCADAERSRR